MMEVVQYRKYSLHADTASSTKYPIHLPPIIHAKLVRSSPSTNQHPARYSSDVNPCLCPCKSSPCPCPCPCRFSPWQVLFLNL